jgi:7,8-dihydropterin-6-yl-methyl-4-(beta-D-ribofuranosyl)aminobenzene 5'-phosphate synthase
VAAGRRCRWCCTRPPSGSGAGRGRTSWAGATAWAARSCRPLRLIALQEGPGRFLGGRALFLTDIPRRTPYEHKRPGGQVLYRVGRSWRVDTTPDDGALVVHVKGQGLVILTGCGHAGVINTVREAVRRTGVSRVWALVGGFHLCNAPPRRIRSTIRDLRAFAPRWVVPSHCSGLEFEAALAETFPRGFAVDSVGTRYSWGAGRASP